MRVEETNLRKNLSSLRDAFLWRIGEWEEAQTAFQQPTVLIAVSEVAARLLDRGTENVHHLRERHPDSCEDETLQRIDATVGIVTSREDHYLQNQFRRPSRVQSGERSADRLETMLRRPLNGSAAPQRILPPLFLVGPPTPFRKRVA